jgi:hypothetical protein
LLPLAARADLFEFFVTVASVAALFAAGVISGGSAFLIIAMSAYGQYKQEEMRRQNDAARDAARDAYNASLEDRTVTRITTEAPFTRIYGRARVGSAVVAVLSSGARDEYQHLVCVHAAHECDGFEETYISTNALGTLDGSGFAVNSPDYGKGTATLFWQPSAVNPFTLDHAPDSGTVKVHVYSVSSDGLEDISAYLLPCAVVGNVVTITSYPAGPLPFSVITQYQSTIYTSTVRVKQHLGTAGEAADATLIAECPAKWTVASKLSDFCYTYLRIDLNQQEFQGGVPGVEALLRGARLYDPRTGLTVWSQNPALVLYDYLTSEFCNVPAADIPIGDVITAANVCDESTAYGPRYTFNGTITSAQDPAQVITQIAQSMAGGINSTTWSMWAGSYVAPTLTLEQTDIVGALAITPGISDADICNGVTGRFIGPENGYTPTDIAPYQNATFLAADGRDLFANMEFPFTDTTQGCHNLARIFVEDQRNSFTVKGMFGLKAWDTAIGQRITLNADFFGIVAKVFRIVGKTYSYNGMVELLMKEDAPEIWDQADAVAVDATPNTGLPNPFQLDAPSSLVLSSGTDTLLKQADGTIVSRIKAVWAASSSVFSPQAELQMRPVPQTDWQSMTPVDATLGLGYLSPVRDGVTYDVRMRFVNTYLSVQSPWTYAAPETVVGKTAAPDDITSLSISGTKLYWQGLDADTNADLAGYIFRFHYGNNLDWGSATPMHIGVVTQSPWDMVIVPGGPVTIMGKALDTSGNESVNAALIVTDLGDVPVSNIVLTTDYKALGWPGTLVGCTVVGGNLQAGTTDSFYGSDSQSFYGADAVSFYDAGTYTAMSYVSTELSISGPQVGAQAVINQTTAGTDLKISYRLAGPGSAYGPDSYPAYGPDDEPFFDGPGPWIAWPGAIALQTEVYQFMVEIGAGTVQGLVSQFQVVVDVPDLEETVQDLTISAAGTTVPYTKPFTHIKTVIATLQANASGAETLEADKTVNLAPKLKAYNSAHTAVSGATADVTLRGY